MAKMWAGRTSGETSKIADDFNSSINLEIPDRHRI